MRLQVNDELGNYVDVDGLNISLGVQDEEYLEHKLTRKQVVELIAMLVSSIHPLPTQQELDEELMRLVFNNLPPGGGLLGKLVTLTEDDFMEDHGDNL